MPEINGLDSRKWEEKKHSKKSWFTNAKTNLSASALITRMDFMTEEKKTRTTEWKNTSAQPVVEEIPI